MTVIQRRGEKIVSAVFGVSFIIASVVLSVNYPEPTVFQYNVFSAVLAVSAAGMAAIIPGTISIELSKFLKVGGAIAIFAVVFLFSPAKYIALEPISDWKEQSVTFTASNYNISTSHLYVRGSGIANVLGNRINVHVNSVDIYYPKSSLESKAEHLLKFYTALMCIKDEKFDFSGWSSAAVDISKDLQAGHYIEINNFDMEIVRPDRNIKLSNCFIMLVVYYGDSGSGSKEHDLAYASPNMFE